IKLELTIGDRRIEPDLDRTPLFGHPQHLWLEDAVAATAGALRRVHRKVCLLQELIAVAFGFAGYRHADAGADADLLAVDLEWFGEHHRQTLGERGCGNAVAKAARDNGELIAAKTRDEIGMAQRRLDAAGGSDQQVVAD